MTTLPSFQAITARCNRLEQIIRLQGLIAGERNNPQLSSLVMKEVARVMDADRVTLFLYDTESNDLRADYGDGLESGAIVVPLKMGVIGAALSRRRSINIVNAQEHAFFNNITDKGSGYRTDTMLALPIIASNGSVLGGLQLINKFGGRFTQQDENTLAAAARTIAEQSKNGQIDAEIARREISTLQENIGCDRSAVFRLDEKSGHLVSVFASGTTDTISVKIKLGIAGYVALTGEALLVADPYSDARFDASFDRSTGYRTQNILAIPLKTAANEILGVVQVLNKYGGCFAADDVKLLETIAGAIGTALENRNLIRELDRQFHSLLEVMAASLDSRDKLTAGHSLRVAQLAVAIAAALGFTAEDTDILKVAATLHDYGKVGVDDAVLRKNGTLSASPNIS